MRTLAAIAGLVAFTAAAYAGFAWYVDGRGAIDERSIDGPLHLAGTPVERGRYLAAAADCVACHTVAGHVEYTGGVAFHLPFGTIYAPNLRPGAGIGIGSWSDDEFLRAVRSGVGRGGRHLYPAHPYTTYAGLARNDVLAIKAYLASLPPVENEVPDSDLRFPFSQRGLMPLWNALFLGNKRFEPDAGHDDAWNRGAYLATALGHCGECHTPRNVAYALQSGRALTGAVMRGWNAYDITAGTAGLGNWTATALGEYLATGHADGHGTASGPMKDVVAYSTSRLTPDDRAALVAYLLAAQPAAGTSPAPLAAEPVGGTRSGGIGATLYAGACAGCHPLEPKAAVGYYSNLAGARSVRDPAATNVLKLLSDDSQHGVGQGAAMPGFGRSYSDAERAAIANFVLMQWGHLPSTLTPNDALRARLPD